MDSMDVLLRVVGYALFPLISIIYYSLTGRIKKLETHMDEEPEAIRNRMLEHVLPLSVRLDKIELVNDDIVALKIQVAVIITKLDALILVVEKLVQASDKNNNRDK